MLKDQEKIRKIAHECAKEYSALKNSGVSSGLQVPPRSWIRAWMQSNYHIIKLSGYFYRVFNEEIWHNDLNESFTTKVIKDKSGVTQEQKRNITKSDIKDVFDRKIKEILEKGGFSISRHFAEPSFPDKVGTYTATTSMLPNSERDCTLRSYRIFLGKSDQSLGTNGYNLRITVNENIEYDDLDKSNTFTIGLYWYAYESPYIHGKCSTNIPSRYFGDSKIVDNTFKVYKLDIETMKKTLLLIKRIISRKNTLNDYIKKGEIVYILNILGLSKSKNNLISESFTSKIIKDTKEKTNDDKRRELFTFPVETIEGETVYIKKSTDKGKNNLFKLLIEKGKVHIWSKYKRSDVHTHTVDDYIDRSGYDGYEYSISMFNGHTAFSSYGIPVQLTYMADYLMGGGAILKISSSYDKYDFETNTYTLTVSRGPSYGEYSCERLNFGYGHKGWFAEMSLYYKDKSNTGPRSRDGKWTHKKAKVTQKDVPWLEEIY